MNICHARWLIGLLMLATLAGGCASRREAGFSPALLPQTPATFESPTLGRVALLVPASVEAQVYEGTKWPANSVRIHAGRIVEEAMFAAMSDALSDRVQRISQPPAADSGFAATLSIDAVRAEDDVRLLWLLPLPFPFGISDHDYSARVSFDLSLLDVQGRLVWARSYDSGLEVYRRLLASSNEPVPDNLIRAIHQAAWRLAQQAITDLRNWLKAERNRPREL